MSVRTYLSEYFQVFEVVQAYARIGNHTAALQATTDAAYIVNNIVMNVSHLVDLSVAEMYNSMR